MQGIEHAKKYYTQAYEFWCYTRIRFPHTLSTIVLFGGLNLEYKIFSYTLGRKKLKEKKNKGKKYNM